VLAPRLLRLHDVIADRVVLDKQPRFIEQEGFECGESLWVCDLVRRAMQDVKQEWLKNFGCIIPAVEIERLKFGERERVLSVVKQKTVLSTASPAV